MTVYHIQIRGDTAAQFTATNPVLVVRELAVETDTGKMKLGNGVTAWNSLAYLPGGSGGSVASTDITDATVTGKAVLTAVSAAAARTAIAAGTSDLALGTTSITALAGNATAAAATKLATARTINGVSFDGTANITVSDAVASVAGRTGVVVLTTADLADFAAAVLTRVQALGIIASVREVAGVYPNRPATTAPVAFIGADAPASGGTTAGGTAAAVASLDLWFRTP